MSAGGKGDKRRKGVGYAEGYDEIFKKPANLTETVDQIFEKAKAIDWTDQDKGMEEFARKVK